MMAGQLSADAVAGMLDVIRKASDMAHAATLAAEVLGGDARKLTPSTPDIWAIDWSFLTTERLPSPHRFLNRYQPSRSALRGCAPRNTRWPATY
jgi:hypothetical protein